MEAGQERVLITRLDEAKARETARLLELARPECVTGEHACRTNADGDDLPFESDGNLSAADGATDLFYRDGVCLFGAIAYCSSARLGIVGSLPHPDGDGAVVVAAAGTSDIAVAEEAAITAEFLGNRVIRLYDVGVAGVHRLLAYEEVLSSAQVVIAVAGMEGALPSVVAGLVPCPVIAVPTSVGYGASFGGVAALLAMLNSCASGVSVVNIDNGFGAGYQASLINHLSTR
ncbi:MAG: nickel pincer cofactor biosynthesis protein LarB [Eggerthellaceae bacterium]|nr:nickel pincer cofactor biosynthesis protein LarB [Eggerthellaceae bacterium]